MCGIIVRNMLSWLESIINRCCCIYLVVYIIRISKCTDIIGGFIIHRFSYFCIKYLFATLFKCIVFIVKLKFSLSMADWQVYFSWQRLRTVRKHFLPVDSRIESKKLLIHFHQLRARWKVIIFFIGPFGSVTNYQLSLSIPFNLVWTTRNWNSKASYTFENHLT